MVLILQTDLQKKKFKLSIIASYFEATRFSTEVH